ncbi:MAG: phosphate acyltransferase PlsX [Rhodospirillaceae bacterium]|nr:phosphate acyltransferase PlsX [Rhodospirillaceae bacterium]
MTDAITVAIDGMGGDNAPGMIIGGIDIACSRAPNLRCLVFGDENQLKPLLENHPKAKAAVEIRHTTDVVRMDDKPTAALRSGKNSSMRLAIDAVKNEEASAIVSAGNTGALMTMATVVLRMIPGISRPAIVTSFPTQSGDCVMLDLGANIECDAENLVQFAVMGEVFARYELDIEQPSIGLLNVGAEGLKGNDSVKKAASILQDSDLPIKFYGFVEGDDIGKGTVDVIVTDGFTGNIALKTAEGTAKMFTFYLKKYLTANLISKIGALIAKPALERFRAHFDPRRYNGAMLVGLNGICVKSHGGTDALGFAHAIEIGVKLVQRDFNAVIKEDLGHLVSNKSEVSNNSEPQSATA